MAGFGWFRPSCACLTTNLELALAEYRAFAKQYLPDVNPETDGNSLYGYAVATTLMTVLRNCGNDVSRKNVMKQAASLKNLTVPLGIAGVVINTSATDFRPITQMQLKKFNGKSFEAIGELINGE